MNCRPGHNVWQARNNFLWAHAGQVGKSKGLDGTFSLVSRLPFQIFTDQFERLFLGSSAAYGTASKITNIHKHHEKIFLSPALFTCSEDVTLFMGESVWLAATPGSPFHQAAFLLPKIIGKTVRSGDDKDLGTITSYYFLKHHPCFTLESPQNKSCDIPLVEDWVSLKSLDAESTFIQLTKNESDLSTLWQETEGESG